MNYDPIDTCPYDSVHRILRSRMQYHLTKCAKNWPCSKKKQCPYDARHIINQIEFNYHVSVCPQRESVWRYKIVENEEQQTKIIPIDATSAAASTDENWDDDVKVQSYDPMKHTENRPVTRILIGASKSERKKYRLQERLRISRLEDAQNVQHSSASQNNSNQRSPSTMRPSVPEASVEVEQEYKPLRRPKTTPLDTSKISDISTVNDSAVVNQTQNSVNQNKQKKSFSYAGATKNVLTNESQHNTSIESDYDVVIESVECDIEKENNSLLNRKEELDLKTTTVNYAAAAKNVPTKLRRPHKIVEGKNQKEDISIESIKFDTEKENSSSVFNSTIDENLVKVTKTVEELTIGDEGHKVQSEFLDKTLESLKKKENYSSVTSNGLNKSKDSKTVTTKEKFSKCAASLPFKNLGQHINNKN